MAAAPGVIAVVMPNTQGVGKGWGQYRVSVKDVEALTGYAFFDRLPPKVAGALREAVDDGPVR